MDGECGLEKTTTGKIVQQVGLIVTVCHYPPGYSKWNPVKRRLFSFII